MNEILQEKIKEMSKLFKELQLEENQDIKHQLELTYLLKAQEIYQLLDMSIDSQLLGNYINEFQECKNAQDGEI